MTSLAWGPVGHCTSGRPLNPPLIAVHRLIYKISAKYVRYHCRMNSGKHDVHYMFDRQGYFINVYLKELSQTHRRPLHRRDYYAAIRRRPQCTLSV